MNTTRIDNDFAAQLSQAGIFHAAHLMGLDADAVFGALLNTPAHPYRRHRWFVNMDEFGNRVIHAAPPEEEMGWTPWERWRVAGQRIVREQWVSEPGRRWRVLHEPMDDLTPRFARQAANLHDQLLRSRIDVAAHELGLDFDATFHQPAAVRYSGYLHATSLVGHPALARRRWAGDLCIAADA